MNRIFPYLFLLAFLFSCSQNKSPEVFENPESTQFPDSWTGRYEGALFVSEHGQVKDTNSMILQLYRLDMNRTAFHIKYGSDSSFREYELQSGKTPNHFVLDEKNSILIDYYFQEDDLTAKFSVDDNLLDINLRKNKDTIVSTTRIIPLQFTRETGDSVQWKIMRYKERGVQRAVLHKTD